MFLFSGKIRPGFKIADLGCGPEGSVWWSDLPTGCAVDAFDLRNVPKLSSENIHFYKKDVTKLYKIIELQGRYDLVVADHVFEHVIKPDNLAASASHILKKQGFLHVGIPDATNFTDRFYRLIHRDGGGHVSQFSKESFIELMSKFGFELIESRPWPDDWRWLEKCYSLKHYGIKHLSQKELQYIVDVFRKELTPEKGYTYGWEFLFKKESSLPLHDSQSYSASHPENLILNRLSPHEIYIGESFNVQPDGESAIWIEAENATENTVLIVNYMELNTTFGSENALSAIMPKALCSKAGKKKTYLLDKETGKKSNYLDFFVKKNKKWPPW
jgi:hypothetical protein